MLALKIDKDLRAHFSYNGQLEAIPFNPKSAPDELIEEKLRYSLAIDRGDRPSAETLASVGWNYFTSLLPNNRDRKRFREFLSAMKGPAFMVGGYGLRIPWDLIYLEDPNETPFQVRNFLGWSNVSCMPHEATEINLLGRLRSSRADVGLVESNLPGNCVLSKTAGVDQTQAQPCEGCTTMCEASALLTLARNGIMRQAALNNGAGSSRTAELQKIIDWRFLKDSRILHLSVQHESTSTAKARTFYRLKICNDFELTRDEVLKSYHTLRPGTVVFLNCCDGAFDRVGDQYSSLAADFPSAACVVTSTTEIGSPSAIAMAKSFYESFKSETVVASVLRARQSLWEKNKDLTGFFYRVHGQHQMRYLDPIDQAFAN
ncbi:MAG: hypothetical protein EP335_06965 [Alphaproteobacteria bacterium]|nr:MAG: hypothetical protein EP335_06965 [Alphaproteobacteria bacterium]